MQFARSILLRRETAIVWIAILVCLSAFSQQGDSQAVAEPDAEQRAELNRLGFDIVSIRKNSGGDAPSGLYLDGYKAIDRPIWQTISHAYFPMRFHDKDWIKGAPSWVFDERYDLIAKVAPENFQAWKGIEMQSASGENPELQAMFRKLLEDRCALKVHRAAIQVDGYDLVVRSKLKLRPAAVNEPSDPNAVVGSDGGSMVISQTEDRRGWKFHNESMKAFLSFLAIFSGKPIEDKTNLKGRYDFAVEVPNEQSDAHPEQSNLDDFLSVQSSLESLGIELHPAKISIDAVIVDHIDRPSAN